MNEHVIVLEGLSKKFGNHNAVNNVNLKVPKGAVFGLLGPNGSGKSTMINMMMGLLPPNAGKISMLNMNPFRDGVAIRSRVGYVPEHYGFYDWMTVDHISQFVANYHTHWNWKLYHDLIHEFQLDKKAQIQNLSKGMKSKLALLLALSFKPEILVLDEPTSGLDPAVRRNFLETILLHYQEEGKTIFVSSHLLNEFSGLLDYVAFLKEGELHKLCSMEELHDKTKRIRLIFDDQPPVEYQFSHVIKQRIDGREMVLTHTHYEPEKTEHELSSIGAKNVLVEEMTLEDIFVDMVG